MLEPSSRFGIRSFFVATLLIVLAAGAAAQDVVTVGTVSAAGTTVEVPIFIRDASGTFLGRDQPAGSRIQAFSIKVTYAPVSSVSSISIERDGITESLSPTSEFKPTTSNSVSLLDTFQESTNLIPFTLNAAAPGNRVARLLVNLSPSATPGTSISLTLDPALTQLTDDGGNAATKETSSNGQLQLVNGSIDLPMPTLTITPSSSSIETGATTTLTARLDVAISGSATVSLASGNSTIASVPSSVTIPAGLKTQTFNVTGQGVGSTLITGTLPQSLGGTSASATVTVTQAQTCTTPAVPQMTTPVATADSGAPYAIAWTLVSAATDYVLQESTDASFATSVTNTVTAPPVMFTHVVTGDTRYYYRVRARNRSGGCDVTSTTSANVSVLVKAFVRPVQAKRILPVVGSTAGAFGSFFKTSVQLFNPGETAISGNIVYHSLGRPDATLAYALGPGKSIGWDDLLPAMGLGGIGTADIVGDAGSPLPVSSVRVFNDAGANGTTGLNEEALRPTDALQAGQTGSIIAVSDLTRFRLNIGVRTLEQGAVMTIVVKDRDGIVLKTFERSYAPTYFEQSSSAAFLGITLTGGESISFRVTSGSAFLYGATTDNTTNDPSLQFAWPVD
jgi:hypothetical protein